MVLFDTTFLCLLLHPDAKPPLDPETKRPVEHAKERIEYLVQSLEKDRQKIVIPTPALAEFLVLAGDAGPQYLAELNNSAQFKIEPFDQIASVEAAAMEREARSLGDKRSGIQETWAKVKFDRQIVAIAKVHGVHTIYSDDADIEKHAKSLNVRVVKVAALPLPPAKQLGLLPPEH